MPGKVRVRRVLNYSLIMVVTGVWSVCASWQLPVCDLNSMHRDSYRCVIQMPDACWLLAVCNVITSIFLPPVYDVILMVWVEPDFDGCDVVLCNRCDIKLIVEVEILANFLQRKQGWRTWLWKTRAYGKSTPWGNKKCLFQTNDNKYDSIISRWSTTRFSIQRTYESSTDIVTFYKIYEES